VTPRDERPPGDNPWPTLIRFGLSLVVGTGVALARLGLACRAPDSARCLWAKSFARVMVPIEAVVFGFLVFGALTLILWLARRSRRG